MAPVDGCLRMCLYRSTCCRRDAAELAGREAAAQQQAGAAARLRAEAARQDGRARALHAEMQQLHAELQVHHFAAGSLMLAELDSCANLLASFT